MANLYEHWNAIEIGIVLADCGIARNVVLLAHCTVTF